MYIQFELPPSLRNVVAGAIEASVFLWADRYNIPKSAYKQKTVKQTHRLSFDNEQHYSLFSLTFTDFNYQIINVGVQKY
jgi:hypothetical protein